MPGQTCWYWLEDVDIYGLTWVHEPVSVVFAAPTAVTLSGLEAAGQQPMTSAWPWLLAGIVAVSALAVARRQSIGS